MTTAITNRREAEAAYAANVLLFGPNDWRLLVHSVVEVGRRWITVEAQRVNRDGTIDKRDGRPRRRSFHQDAVTEITTLAALTAGRQERRHEEQP